MIEQAIIDTSEKEDEDIGERIGYSITSYGADYPIDSLVKRLRNKDISVPDFQRNFVWNLTQASRFIESLLLGLPVPGIFLYRQPATQRLVVVDGHQRLRSIQCFYDGLFKQRPFSLKGVEENLKGLNYQTLGEDDRRNLDNSILHATVFQQLHPESDKSSIYQVFERLNTTGVPLSAQEIRACIYRGSFNDLLHELNDEANWKAIYGQTNQRSKGQELILRFFALKDNLNTYSRPLKKFLNTYMSMHSDANSEWINEQRNVFKNTVLYAQEYLTRQTFCRGRTLNAAITDAMLVGLALRLEDGPITTPSDLKETALLFRDSVDFLEVTDRTTTDVSSVNGRIEQALSAFRRVT